VSEPSDPQGRERAVRAHPQLRWLASTLWGGSGDVVVSLDGRVPAGFRPVRSFLVVPGRSRARFLLPVDRRAAAASLRRYNALRPVRRRLARGMLGAVIRVGLGERVFRSRVRVCVREDMSDDALGDVLLEEHLRRVAFGDAPVEVTIGVGRQGPSRKPVLQVFTAQGEPAGYVKIGWNDDTRELVRNEVRMLTRIREHPPASLWTPEVIHSGSWLDHEISVVLPLPPDARRAAERAVPPLRAIHDLSEILGPPIELPLDASPFCRALDAELAAASPPVADPGRRLLAGVVARAPTLRFGAWHGDLTPWNVAWTGERIAVWDWEHGGVAAPLGFDAVHWGFQVSFILERHDLETAVEDVMREAPAWLRALGVSHDHVEPTIALHLLTLATRAERAARGGAGRRERFSGPLPGVLGGLAERLGDASGP
jgi:phosphotransferase family enzyme